ncbi:MAG: patatin-like phospholipase family protein [Bacteroidales bacterium]|nr:patatin-like phospholipase family protein [Candidatus Physcocola equi]
MSKKYKLGLALSGGGIRGVAHIGVLKALEEYGLKPDVISGVSAGSIVAAMYADGHSVEEMLSFFQQSSFAKSTKLNMPKNGGFMSTKGYANYLKQILKATTFEELEIPLIINATELQTGTIEYFTSGDLLSAVVASSSVPILFNPTKRNGKYYVDGGVLCNLPAQVLREDCDIVIGVHVNPILPMPEKTNYGIMTVAERVFHLAVNGNTVKEKSFCDIVIDMCRNQPVGMFESSKSNYLMDFGYETAIAALKNFDFDRFGFTLSKKY